MIVNLQRKVKIDAKDYSPFVASIVESVDEADNGSFSVAFVSDTRMKELNAFFRGKDATTDVLSFPHEPDEFEQNTGSGLSLSDEEHSDSSGAEFLGDIVISVEQAARQAIENKLTLDREIKQLILHGLLHLCGYDHETDDGQMNRRELELRKKLKI